MKKENSPVPSEIKKEQGSITIRVGDSVLTLTAGDITLEQNRTRPDFESAGGSSKSSTV